MGFWEGFILIMVVWNVFGYLLAGMMQDWYALDPWTIWEKTNVNIFGCILLTIFFNLLCPIITIICWLCVICTIGRKK